jgi:hypothetical protein
MTVTSSWNLDLLDPRLSEIQMDAANRPEARYKKLFDLKDGNNRKMFPMPDKVKTMDVSTLGPMAETDEHNPFYEDEPVRGYTKETSYKKFTIQHSFSEEAADDDLYGVVDQYAAKIGESYELTREILGARVYDNLHNTTYHTAPDGLAICSTAHTSRASAATRSNKLAVSASFSSLGVQKLLTQARRQKDMRGYPNPVMVDGAITLLLQPEDEWMYIKLFSAVSTYETDSDSNNPNPMKHCGRTFTPILNEYQTGTGTTSTRLWAMINGKGSGIWLVDRWPLKPHTWLQDGNLTLVHSGRARFGYHVKTWENIYASGD